MKTQAKPKIHILTILAGVLLMGILITLVVLLMQLGNQENTEIPEQPTTVLTIIPAPTKTQVITVPTTSNTSTPEPTATLIPNTIGVGAYIKVTGTEGVGLRIRSAAGTTSEVLFLAMDEEVFLIIGGPVEKDDYTWWQLEAPYDKTRTGWCAEPFITIIEQEEP